GLSAALRRSRGRKRAHALRVCKPLFPARPRRLRPEGFAFSLCSGFSYILSIRGKCGFLWKMLISILSLLSLKVKEISAKLSGFGKTLLQKPNGCFRAIPTPDCGQSALHSTYVISAR